MKVLLLVSLLAATVSAGHSGGHGGAYGGGHGSGHGGDYGVPTAYKFDYSVNDPHYGPQFAHSESNDGKTAQGYYSVALPDGRTQHVKYSSDQYGYGGHNAQVTYSGYGGGAGHGAGQGGVKGAHY